mgnify:CR=1 FL=1
MGGKLAYLECEDTPGLIRFYEENGFYRFGNRNLDKDEPGQKRYLAQMIKYFSSTASTKLIKTNRPPKMLTTDAKREF